MGYNASQTKSPVHNYLPTSPFKMKRGDYIFYFSTEKHMRKFADEIEKKENWLSDSLSRRFHLPVNATVIAGFQLYQQIEGRGFFVENIHSCESVDSPEGMSFIVMPFIKEC